MVKFKSWRDIYLFLREYGSFTCLQCNGCNHNLDTSMEHSDSDYARFFCTKTISMVRLDFQFVCPEWENKDGDRLDEDDMTKCAFNIPVEIIDILENELNGEWTFEQVKRLIDEYEETIE